MIDFLKQIFGFIKRLNESKSFERVVYDKEKKLKKNIDTLKINGHKLPKALINRFKNDTWIKPISANGLEELILKKCPFENEINPLKDMMDDFTLYTLSTMKNESEHLSRWLHTKWDSERTMFLGKKDDSIPPGDIDAKGTILFADFGIGNDTPIALDFRNDTETPSVVMLYWGEDCNEDNRWKKIANSFEEFEKIIWKEE